MDDTRSSGMRGTAMRRLGRRGFLRVAGLGSIGLAGAAFARWVKARKPEVYANLGRTFHQELG